jgi:hypothetical protein
MLVRQPQQVRILFLIQSPLAVAVAVVPPLRTALRVAQAAAVAEHTLELATVELEGRETKALSPHLKAIVAGTVLVTQVTAVLAQAAAAVVRAEAEAVAQGVQAELLERLKQIQLRVLA